MNAVDWWQASLRAHWQRRHDANPLWAIVHRRLARRAVRTLKQLLPEPRTLIQALARAKRRGVTREGAQKRLHQFARIKAWVGFWPDAELEAQVREYDRALERVYGPVRPSR
jgi:hypothetical protein